MNVPQNTVVYSTPHIALTWFIKQTITIVGFKKGAQKSTQRKRRKGARRSKAAGVCAVLPSCPIRPFTAPSAPFCFWSLESQNCPFFGSTRKGHMSKNLESLINYLERRFTHTNHYSQHGFQETKSCEHIHIN